jgi:hypothetical protein
VIGVLTKRDRGTVLFAESAKGARDCGNFFESASAYWQASLTAREGKAADRARSILVLSEPGRDEMARRKSTISFP